jgi:hypothetical protein
MQIRKWCKAVSQKKVRLALYIFVVVTVVANQKSSTTIILKKGRCDLHNKGGKTFA